MSTEHLKILIPLLEFQKSAFCKCCLLNFPHFDFFYAKDNAPHFENSEFSPQKGVKLAKGLNLRVYLIASISDWISTC